MDKPIHTLQEWNRTVVCSDDIRDILRDWGWDREILKAGIEELEAELEGVNASHDDEEATSLERLNRIAILEDANKKRLVKRLNKSKQNNPPHPVFLALVNRKLKEESGKEENIMEQMTKDLLNLLDEIELSDDSTLAKQRFNIAKIHGYTVVFGAA